MFFIFFTRYIACSCMQTLQMCDSASAKHCIWAHVCVHVVHLHPYTSNVLVHVVYNRRDTLSCCRWLTKICLISIDVSTFLFAINFSQINDVTFDDVTLDASSDSRKALFKSSNCAGQTDKSYADTCQQRQTQTQALAVDAESTPSENSC